MKTKCTGTVWKFGDNVSTDSIAPGYLFHLRSDPPEYAKHVFEAIKPEFAQKVKADDLVVAGSNFGCGSSREIAPMIIKLAGVGAILAKSFGRIFYRNAINNGMLLIQCDTDSIDEGEDLVVDLAANEIRKEKDPGYVQKFQLGTVEKKIVAEDGLLNYIKKHRSLDGL